MEVKLIKTDSVYNTMKHWWDGQNEAHVPRPILPETTFVCFNDEGTPVYTMCFYNTDSYLAWIGWQLANPYVNKEDKKGCFKFLFEEVEKYAKEAGYQILFTTSKTPAVQATLLNSGFMEGDLEVNHYLKGI